MTVGEHIRHLRTSKGWSQKELGARLGVVQTHVSKWELDQMLPSAANLARISELFGVPISVFSDGLRGGLAEREEGDVDLADDSLDPEIAELARFLLEEDRKHPGTKARFLQLIAEGFLSRPEDCELVLDVLRAIRRRSET